MLRLFPLRAVAQLASLKKLVLPTLALNATVSLLLSAAAEPLLFCRCTVTCDEHTPATSVTGADENAILLSMLKLLLVAPVRVPLLAESVYPLPALSMLSVENVAVPDTAATVAVPLSVPTLGFVPIATVTFAVLVVAFPNWS